MSANAARQAGSRLTHNFAGQLAHRAPLLRDPAAARSGSGAVTLSLRGPNDDALRGSPHSSVDSLLGVSRSSERGTGRALTRSRGQH